MWTDEKLAELPIKSYIRLRGLEMTRLETFCDAAFAFALTMLVISVDSIPSSFAELIHALKGTPAFAASFAMIASVWAGHRKWSRRYGLEDSLTTIISLGMVFVMMIYVYPLKMVFSAMFSWMTNGWAPTNFSLSTSGELIGIFQVYGVGFFALHALIGLLYWRALHAAKELRLNNVEIASTNQGIISYGILAMTGLVSVLLASVLTDRLAVYAGFAYTTLCVSMPWISIVHGRKLKVMKDQNI